MKLKTLNIPQPEDQSIRLIPLTRGLVCKVDADSYKVHGGYNWHAVRKNQQSEGFYAARNIRVNGKRVALYMHRLIAFCLDGETVDHVDGDGLNNLRSNLRKCTLSQNQFNRRIGKNNTSGYKGVSPHGNAWLAQIRHNGKFVYLGRFSTPEAAHEAYKAKSKELHGEFYCP